MIVTWTTLRAHRPVPAAPWQPAGARWWQAGASSPGRAAPPQPDGCWWSVLATWDDERAAAAGPPAGDGLDAWHVVLEAASCSGTAVLAGGAQPFTGLPSSGRTEGATAVVTLAQPGPDEAREREFFRRFLHLGRDVATAPGHLAALVHAPEDGAVAVLSAWTDLDRALDWSYVRPMHAAAVERQRTHRLTVASGVLRCAVLASRGTLGGLPDPLAGLRGAVVGAVPAG